jgi:hypothetical protein
MGSKNKAPAPDYSTLANASKESAAIMAALGNQQLDFSKQQYQDMLPFMQGIATDQRAMMSQQMDQAKDYYQYQQDTYRPLEEQMVAEARAYNTDANRERLAGQAAADAGRAFATTQQASQRNLASMGVNPNSGRFAGATAASNLGLAGGKAAAMSQTRAMAEALGQDRITQAIGLGRNLPGNSQGAYSGALNAGNAAGNNMQQPGQNYLAGMAQGAGFIGRGREMYQSGLGNALNGQMNLYSQDQSKQDPLMQLAGMGLGMFMSTKQAKTKTGAVDAQAVSRAVAAIPVERWRYKPGRGDGGEHVGPYAEDMQKLGAATPDGKAIDVISALGLNLAAVKGLSQRLDKMEQANG